MHRYFFFLLAASLLVLSGCRTPQTVKDVWKGTRSYYYEYLNTPAKLDMDDRGNVLDYESGLGSAIAEFDMQLQELERVLQNSDRQPDAQWVATMTTRFPWLSGIALTDAEGVPQAKIPAVFPKPFVIGTLLEADPKQQLKDLRAFIQDDPQGPEIYVGNPVYSGADFRGVITVHFDPRVLLARTSDPTQVMLAGPDGIIWPAVYDAAATPIANVNWAEKVKSEVSGIERNELGAFYWICRYIGNLPLIYAIRIQGDFPIHEENLKGLAEANEFAIGAVSLSSMQQPAPEDAVPSDEGVPPAEITPDGRNSPLEEPGLSRNNDHQDGTPLSE